MYPVGIPENEILVLNMSGQVKGTRLVVEVKSRANVLRVLDLQSPTSSKCRSDRLQLGKIAVCSPNSARLFARTAPGQIKDTKFDVLRRDCNQSDPTASACIFA